jgi:sugar phosphate isomerase/epimerase
MNLSFTTLGCPAWTLERAVQAAREYGYDGIELRLVDGEILKPGADVERIRAALNGLPVCCVDTSVALAQPDPAARAAQIADGKAMIDIAAALNSPFIRVFGMPPKDTDRETAIAAARITMAALAEYGAQHGVCVLLETHDFFCDSPSVMRVLEGTPPGGAGVLWDLLHPNRIGEATDFTLRTIGDRLRHVHVKDGTRPPDDNPNWPLVLLGHGDVPTPAILATLKAAGYTGWLSVEWEKKWHPHLAEPEVALPQHITLLKEWMR